MKRETEFSKNTVVNVKNLHQNIEIGYKNNYCDENILKYFNTSAVKNFHKNDKVTAVTSIHKGNYHLSSRIPEKNSRAEDNAQMAKNAKNSKSVHQDSRR